MYHVNENGWIFHNDKLISLNECKVFKPSKDCDSGTVFVNNLLYESRLTGLSIPDVKKIHNE